MNRHAIIENVLLQTDDPEVVLARDALGVLVLGLLVSRDKQGDIFLAVPLSSGRLADIRAGKLDLREAFLRPETGEVFSADFSRIDGRPVLRLSELPEIPPAWLPQPEFWLSDFLDIEEDSAPLIAVATERGGAVVELSLNPPEAYAEPKIDADRLGEALKVFQNLVRHAYTRGAGAVSESWRRFFGGENAFTLEVFAFSHGSFRIHLQSKGRADLSGLSALGLALAKIDELTQYIDSPDHALEVVKQNRGHVVSAYQALLKFVVEQGTPLRYEWADPASREVSRRRISPEHAGVLYELLVARQELSREEVSHVGVFSKVDEDRGTWTLRTEERELHGELSEGVGNLLAGLTIRTKQYRVKCEERLEEVAGSGRQRVRLLMLSRDELAGGTG